MEEAAAPGIQYAEWMSRPIVATAECIREVSIGFVRAIAWINSTAIRRAIPREEGSMRQGLSLAAVGHATSLFLAIAFSLCVAFDLLFPSHAMFKAWQDLLPGFRWISWP